MAAALRASLAPPMNSASCPELPETGEVASVPVLVTHEQCTDGPAILEHLHSGSERVERRLRGLAGDAGERTRDRGTTTKQLILLA